MKPVIIPSVFATSPAVFRERYELATSLSSRIQIDIMDGSFVPVKIIPLDQMPDLNTKDHIFEADLMASHPATYLDALSKKGFAKVIIHVEALEDESEGKAVIARIKELGMVPSISCDAQTPLGALEPYLALVEDVQLMGIHAGKEGQPFQEQVIDKVRQLRQDHPRHVIEIDGGVNLDSAPRLVEAGASLLVIGSYLAKSPDPKEALKTLEEAIA